MQQKPPCRHNINASQPAITKNTGDLPFRSAKVMLSQHALLLSLLMLVSTTTAIHPPLLTNALYPLTASSPLAFMAGVDTDKYPDWAGKFDPEDCTRARGLLSGRIAYWDPAIRWKFWSRRWVTMPEGRQWELPFGTSFREWPPLSPLLSFYSSTFISFHFFFFLRFSVSNPLLPTNPTKILTIIFALLVQSPLYRN